MKVPCRDCLTLAICRQRVRGEFNLTISFCPLINSYVYDKKLFDKRPMYRYARVNKVRRALGLRKVRHRKS